MRYFKIFISKLEELVQEDLLNYTQKEVPPVFFLNLSCLAGEYYTGGNSQEFYQACSVEFKKLEQVLRQLNSKIILQEQKLIESSTATANTKAKIQKLKELHKFFNSLGKLYRKLVEKAERDFTHYDQVVDLYNDYEIFEINLIDEINRHQYDRIGNSEDFENDIFQINIKLSEIDINLDCDEDIIKKLIGYELFLKKQMALSNKYTNFIIEVLLDKCRFLLAKIYLRKLKQAIKDKSLVEENFYNDSYQKLKKNIRYYDVFLEKAYHHYFGVEDNLVSYNLKNQIAKKDKLIELSDVHNASKYFRTSKDLKKIKLLLESINDKEITGANASYNDFAITSTINLVKNTKLRIELGEEKKNDFKKTIKTLRGAKKDEFYEMFDSAIGEFSGDRGLYTDYYPYTQVLSFLNDLLDHLIDFPLELLNEESQKELKEGKSVQEAIEKLGASKGAIGILREAIVSINESYIHAYRICNHKKYKPIYLCYEESKVLISPKLFETDPIKTDLGQIELFVESAHILPDDYQRIKDTWRTIKRRLDDKIIMLRNSLEVVTQVKFYEKSFKKEVENKEFKLVQALAMFIGIATLILGSIKATENRTVLSSVIIIFSLGSVLMLFNYFIYWFVRSDRKIKLREIILIMLIGAGIYTAYYYAKENDETRIQSKYNADSLAIYKRFFGVLPSDTAKRN